MVSGFCIFEHVLHALPERIQVYVGLQIRPNIVLFQLCASYPSHCFHASFYDWLQLSFLIHSIRACVCMYVWFDCCTILPKFHPSIHTHSSYLTVSSFALQSLRYSSNGALNTPCFDLHSFKSCSVAPMYAKSSSWSIMRQELSVHVCMHAMFVFSALTSDWMWIYDKHHGQLHCRTMYLFNHCHLGWLTLVFKCNKKLWLTLQPFKQK